MKMKQKMKLYLARMITCDVQNCVQEQKMKQKMKLYTARMITCDVQNCDQELKIPCR